MSFLTKKEMTVAAIVITFVLIVGGIAAYICLKRDIIKLPEPQIKLIDDRVTEKEVTPRATALNNSAHTESVLAANTISTGYKTQIKVFYQLNDGTHFYHTVLDFVPGEGDEPSGKSILQYNISHAITDAPTVKECLEWKLDPKVTSIIVTWYVPYEDSNVCFSLMDVDGDGEWDLLANENIKYAHSDEKGANLVYEDKAGHQIYAEYERAKEVTSDLTYETAMEEWLTQEDPE